MTKPKGYNQLPVYPVLLYKKDGSPIRKTDVVVIEEALEIIVIYSHNPSSQNTDHSGVSVHGNQVQHNLSITMRSPGYDDYLVAGFLYNEGIIKTPEQIVDIQAWGPKVGKLGLQNTIRVMLDNAAVVDEKKLQRHFFTHAGCGICGKTSLEALAIDPPYTIQRDQPVLELENLLKVDSVIRQHQMLFQQTGASHSAALLNRDCEVIQVMEDVGRHNALDKLVGYALQEQLLPVDQCAIYLSGRLSFELVQKAIMAGAAIVVSVGAPSNTALELAQEYDLTVIGFFRNQQFTIYHGGWRLNLPEF